MSVPALRFKNDDGKEFPEWEKRNISEILKIGSGKDYKKLESGDIPVYGTGGYMLSVNDYLYDGESVCIGRKGTIDRPVLLSGKFWTVDTLFYTHSFVSSLPKFIYALFQNIDWKNYNEASGVPSLSKSTIEKIEVFIPSLPEQTKIANFLTAVDDKITLLTQKASLLSQYKKGVMQQIFSQELRFKDDDGQEFPEWEEKTLGDIAKFMNGKGHESIISEQGRFIVVNSKFIASNGLVFKTSKQALTPIEKDSVVMVMSDVPNGKALAKCFYIKESDKYTLNQRICSLKSDKTDNKFLFYVINRNPYFIAFDSGVGQTNLKKDEVLSCPIILPTALLEQTKIANFLTAIDEKITTNQTQLNAVKQYKQGLLQQMFV